MMKLKVFKKCLNSISFFLLLNMEYQPTRPNKKATWCSTSTKLLIHFRWEHVKWKDVTMEVDVRDLSNTKGPSMFLPKNSNHQICWSDLPILSMARSFYQSNLPIQSNLVIRNFFLTLKLFLNAKSSLSVWSKLIMVMENGPLTPIFSLSKRFLSPSLTVIFIGNTFSVLSLW